MIRKLPAVLGVGVLGLGLAACSDTPPPASDREPIGVDYSEGEPAADSSEEWTLGTTDAITSVDPAGAYDIGSWNLQYQMFQQLMTVPANGSEPEPDAAECAYDDPKTITCTLQDGLMFANGNELTSSDVKYSLERNIAINDPNGSAILLGSIMDDPASPNPKLAPGAVETPNDTTVVFNLSKPDTTFLKVLSTATASIVDEQVYPANKELADTDEHSGSGPYMLTQYKEGQQAVFELNESYGGPHPGIAPRVFVSFHKDDTSLTSAVKTGEVDVAWRSMSPTQQKALADDDIAVLKGQGSEFRYWVWDMNNGAGTDDAVRQAVAQVIDRDQIATNAYDGTVEPAYSIVPPGFGGQKDSFAEEYGDPDADAAEKILSDAGVETPVALKLGYPQEHYGPNAVDEATEIAEQLNATDLFDVTAEAGEWEQYQTDYKKSAYDLFMLGWYPDFLDADNYLSPFVVDGGFFANGYSNPEVNELVDAELGETDEGTRDETIGQIQDIVAQDVPLIPTWNGANVAAVGDGVGGVQDTLDPTYVFRFWMITKS
ncbi:ABC transporter substrate-binding protein [Nocardioides sambongensis]|uniref:ABC transporter substrate-binding protein n=1 Tax=Nocardioides sambongensis TaxID=2589074 RepID=UPI00112D7AD6|nr:ABC transporter substrate-binding protein [Nocardioides sambongensis]